MKMVTSSDLKVRHELFEVLAGSTKSQAASMVLHENEVSGEYGTEHPDSDQWLYVVEGRGTALIEGTEYALSTGDTLLIDAGERHQIKCVGETPLRTINFYSPPAY